MTKLSDFELNKAIAKFIHPNYEIAFPGDFPNSSKVRFISKKDYDLSDVDYCNNWNDLMPLVIEHGQRMEWPWVWTMTSYPPSFFYDITIKENPQRALAETLLKVLEAK